MTLLNFKIVFRHYYNLIKHAQFAQTSPCDLAGIIIAIPALPNSNGVCKQSGQNQQEIEKV